MREVYKLNQLPTASCNAGSCIPECVLVYIFSTLRDGNMAVLGNYLFKALSCTILVFFAGPDET